MGDFDDDIRQFAVKASWYWPGPWAFGCGLFAASTNKRFHHPYIVFNFGPLECSAGWL
jgi:hypothetical protein